MKYKKITEITKEELNTILSDIFKFSENEGIVNIKNDNIGEIVTVTIKTNWSKAHNKLESIEDEIYLNDFEITTNNMDIRQDELYRYLQFLLAKGYHYLWKDNNFC